MAAFGLAEVAPQFVEQAVEGPVLLPLHAGPGDDPSGGQVMGHRPPWAAGADDVEPGIADFAAVGLGGAAAGLGGRDDAGDLGPLAVGQVGRVALGGVHTRRLGHPF